MDDRAAVKAAELLPVAQLGPEQPGVAVLAVVAVLDLVELLTHWQRTTYPSIRRVNSHAITLRTYAPTTNDMVKTAKAQNHDHRSMRLTARSA